MLGKAYQLDLQRLQLVIFATSNLFIQLLDKNQHDWARSNWQRSFFEWRFLNFSAIRPDIWSDIWNTVEPDFWMDIRNPNPISGYAAPIRIRWSFQSGTTIISIDYNLYSKVDKWISLLSFQFFFKSQFFHYSQFYLNICSNDKYLFLK